MSETFFPAVADADLGEGEKRSAELNGWPVLLCRVEGQVHAVINRCTHAASALVDGRIRRGAIMCPLHGARFELASGRCMGAPYPPLRTFPTAIADGQITVAIPDSPPPAELMPVMPV